MERTCHRYKTNTFLQNFRIQKQIYRNMLKKAKTEAVSNKVTECGNNTKKLYKIVITFKAPIKKNLYHPVMIRTN